MTNDALIERYQALLQQRPGDELALFSLGKALFDAGRFAEAETHLRQALDAKPDWMVVAMLLAKCALHRGDQPAARQLYEDALGFAIAQHHEGPEEEIRHALEHLPA
jgi:Flp pilus assembly protein TadD